MLLDQSGLQIAKFDRPLAELLGADKGEEGHKVLAEGARCPDDQERGLLYHVILGLGVFVEGLGHCRQNFIPGGEDAAELPFIRVLRGHGWWIWLRWYKYFWGW